MRSLLLAVLVLAACSGSPEPVCPVPTGDAVTHANSFTGTETWAATSLHRITADLTVAAGATITLEPCTQVVIADGRWWYIDGTVIAKGEAAKPITIKGDGARFASIRVRHPGKLELAYATVSGGGSALQSTYGSNIIAEGTWPPKTPLFVDHVTIDDAAGHGVMLKGYAAFAAGSQDLTVKGSGKTALEYPFPVRISLNATGSLPTGSYTGNGVDEILLIGENPHYQVEIDDTLHDRGVPYRMGDLGQNGELRVGAIGSVPTLTIDPGVTVRMESMSKTARVYVGTGGSTGQLVAVGTAEKKIVFTSARSPQANGDWIGVDFANPVAAGNRMEFTRIEFAGAPGLASGYGCPPMTSNHNDAALRVYGPPASAFFTSSSIEHSRGHAVLSGWQGAQVDFKAGNSFTDIGGCEQVQPKLPAGGCPSNPMCQ